MNLRIFLTTSSLAILGWLSASYFHAISVDSYLSASAPPAGAAETLELAEAPAKTPHLVSHLDK